MASASTVRAGRAYVELFADRSKLKRDLTAAAGDLKQFGESVGATGKKLILGGAAGLGILGFSAKAFGGFEQIMAMVATQLEKPAEHLDRFKREVRALAVEFGEDIEPIGKALYEALSAGIDPTGAMAVVRAAMVSAKAGMTDTATATSAVIDILNSYGMAATQAGDVADFLFQTNLKGKTTFEDLAKTMGGAASMASAAGLSLDEFGAAVATMTANGKKTEDAVVGLKNIVGQFLNPTNEAAEAARKYGFELNTATLRTLGLKGVMERLANASPEDIAKIFPDVRGLTGFLAAMKGNASFAEILEDIKRRGGAVSTAYEKVADTLVSAFKRAKAAALDLWMAIGEPIANELKKLGPPLEGFLAALTRIVERNKEWVVWFAKIALAAVGLGTALVVVGMAVKAVGLALGAFAVFGATLAVIKGLLAGVALAISTLLSPVGLVVAAVIGLGVAFETQTGVARTFLAGLGETFGRLKDTAAAAFAGIRDALAAGDIDLAAKVLWAGLHLLWVQGTNGLQESFGEALRAMGSDFSQWSTAVGGFFGQLGRDFQETFIGIRTDLTNFFQWLGDWWFKRWFDLLELIGSITAEQAQQYRDAVDKGTKIKRDENERQRGKELGQSGEYWKNFNDALKDQDKAADKKRKERADKAKKELDDAREQAATARLDAEREASENAMGRSMAGPPQKPPPDKPPPPPPPDIYGASKTIGTFSATAANRLGLFSVEGKAVEQLKSPLKETAANTGEIVKAQNETKTVLDRIERKKPRWGD